MAKKIIQYLIYFINLPLYILSLFIPRDENLWLFGAWHGERYADNTRYLFEYVTKEDNEIRSIWLTQNKDLYSKLKEQHIPVILSYSVKGYFVSMRAKYFFITSGYDDINKYTIGNANVVNLYHGTPLKKVGCDANKRFNYFCSNKMLRDRLKFFLFPFERSNFQYFISASDETTKIFQSSYGIEKSKILLTGFPRNDTVKQKKRNSKIIILYLPTFRDNSHIDLFETFQEADYTKLINKYNIEIIYKLHFADTKTQIPKTHYIKKLSQEIELHNYLKNVDILITDYSGIYFDFLLTENPIIFTPFDIDTYISKDRQLYYNYNDVTPGPKCHNWYEVSIELEKFLKDENYYRDKRSELCDRFNYYRDSNSSERVYKFFKNL